jgi:hypothetical protein
LVVGRGSDKSNLKNRLVTGVPALADADEAILDRLLDKAQVVKLGHDRFVFLIRAGGRPGRRPVPLPTHNGSPHP